MAVIKGIGSKNILFYTSSLERMRIDNATGNIGIGTSSPQVSLEIVGSLRLQGPANFPTTGSGLEIFYNSGFSEAGIQSYNRSTSSYINTFVDGLNLSLRTGGSERIKVTNAGRVGIGAVSPSLLLDILGVGTAYGSLISHAIIHSNSAYNANPSAGLNFGGIYNSTNTYTEFGGISVSKTNNTDGDYGSYLSLHTRTNGSPIAERLRIDSSGKITTGIQNIALSTNYAIAPNVFGGPTTAVGSLNTIVVIGDDSVYTNPPTSGISFAGRYRSSANDWVVYGGISGGKENVTDGNYSGYLAFHTRANGGTPTEKMRVDASGNVGIGKSPAVRFDVAGGRSQFAANSETFAVGFKYSDAAGPFYIGATNSATPDLIFSTAGGGETVRITNSGNLGVGGTISPIYNIDLTKSVNSALVLRVNNSNAGTSAGSAIYFGNDADGAIFKIIQNSIANTSLSGAQSTNFINIANAPISFSTNNSERMRIDGSGNIGVGTTTINSRIHACSGIANTSGDSLAVDAATFTGANYNFGTASNPVMVSLQSNSTLGANVGATLGLGGRYTSTSYANFAIIKGAKENATDGNYATYLAFGTRAHAADIQERMRIDSAGNVGIGSTAAIRLYALESLQTQVGFRIHATHASYNTEVAQIITSKANNTDFNLLACYTNGGADYEFKVRGDGVVYSDGGTAMSAPADYAEMFEWADGNPNNEDRVGMTVSLVANKIKIAEVGENIIGVVSGNPAVLGDSAWNKWSEKYIKDDFNRYLTTEDGFRILNQNFDPEAVYIPRISRKEWSPVGLVGKLRIKKNQVLNPNWILMRNISNNVDEYLVK